MVMRGVNDDEVVDFATFGRERGVSVRFIEFMPLDARRVDRPTRSSPGTRSSPRSAPSIRSRPAGHDHTGPEPAEVFRYADGRGDFGVIASVTNAFCDSCDRVRLTAEGQLRSCLFALDEIDLRALLRGGASDDDLAAAIERCVAAKWAGHRHQPGAVHPPPALDEPDRRLSRPQARTSETAGVGRGRPRRERQRAVVWGAALTTPKLRPHV